MEFKKPLPEKEQNLLLEELKEIGNQSIKEKLILHNLRLVNWFAKKYYKEHTPGRELEDLFQEGVIGLIKAIEDYKPDEGAFSTYAAIHIKGSIFRAITNKVRVIRIPSHKVDLINQYKKAYRELYTKLEREPTENDMCIKLDITLDKVKEIVSLLNNPISLNTIIGGEENDITLEDTIVDDKTSIDKIVENKILGEKLYDELKKRLSNIQFDCLRLNIGLGCRQHTLAEIASILGVNPEYVRTQRDKALLQIRRTRLIHELDDRTSFIRGVDYSRPRVSGGIRVSPVESSVLVRERIREQIIRKMEE